MFVYNRVKGGLIMIDYSKFPNNDILCIDMRSFYASCEAVSMGLDPNNCYLAVVGDPSISSSIVLAASPKLKKDFNIKTGNRLFDIPKNKNIHIVGARMGYYLKTSIEITKVFYQYAPLEDIHVYSIDEAWLKINGSKKLFGNKYEISKKIQSQILSDFGLHCAIGIGPNRLLSKVCLDNEAKNTGIACWDYCDVPKKLWPLPTKKCWGIGKAMARNLRALGIETLGDLAHFPLDILERRFGIIGNQLYYHAWGIDLSPMEGNLDYFTPKSIGKGITLEKDYKDFDCLCTVILELCEDICRRARKQRLTGRTVHLSLSYSKAQGGGGFSHSLTMACPSNLTMDIYKLCLQILKSHNREKWVRKISISLGNLSTDKTLQLNFFSSIIKERKIAKVMDELEDRFGPASIIRGRFLNKEAITFKQKNKIGGHNL